MSDQSSIWKTTKRPVGLEGRVEFPGYDETRDFLDAVAEVSEELGVYPNTSFARTHVSMTLQLEDGAEALSAQQLSFAQRVDGLIQSQKSS